MKFSLLAVTPAITDTGEQTTIWNDIWHYIYNTYINPTEFYENIGAGTLTTVRLIIIGMFIGLALAAYAAVFNKRVLGALVRRILEKECLSPDRAMTLDELGYAKNGKANFAVWTDKEYDELQKMLHECISIVSDLNRKTAELAANITADLAPSHIRKNAEYVGAFVYRFYSIDKLVSKLFDMDWIKAVGDNEKPAVCVVRN